LERGKRRPIKKKGTGVHEILRSPRKKTIKGGLGEWGGGFRSFKKNLPVKNIRRKTCKIGKNRMLGG